MNETQMNSQSIHCDVIISTFLHIPVPGLCVQCILVYPALDYPAPRLTGRVSLLLKGEKALSNKLPSFRFSAIVLMKVKLFNNLFC